MSPFTALLRLVLDISTSLFLFVHQQKHRRHNVRPMPTTYLQKLSSTWRWQSHRCPHLCWSGAGPLLVLQRAPGWALLGGWALQARHQYVFIFCIKGEGGGQHEPGKCDEFVWWEDGGSTGCKLAMQDPPCHYVALYHLTLGTTDTSILYCAAKQPSTC